MPRSSKLLGANLSSSSTLSPQFLELLEFGLMYIFFGRSLLLGGSTTELAARITSFDTLLVGPTRLSMLVLSKISTSVAVVVLPGQVFTFLTALLLLTALLFSSFGLGVHFALG